MLIVGAASGTLTTQSGEFTDNSAAISQLRAVRVAEWHTLGARDIRKLREESKAMKRTIQMTCAVVSLMALWAPAQAGHGCGRGGLSIGIGIGAPYYYRPWYPYYGYGYYPYPYPVYVAPPPVVVQSAPVIQQVPVAQPAPTYQAPAPTPLTARSAPAAEPPGVDHHLQMLSNTDDNVRAESVIELGRMKAQRAVDPLAATLSGDRSPMVRETAARALGLIGSPQALPALQHAAQADSDREVRRSAQFAVEVIHSRN